MESDNPWVWDERYKDHYRNNVYEWYSSSVTPTSIASQAVDASAVRPNNEPASLARDRSDSVAPDPNMAPAASAYVRPRLYFTGTPERGWYEIFDTRYRVRTRAEAHQFFTKGRVLAMLWAETQSETSARNFGNGTENTAITVGRFGQGVFSQIRRFVVVRVNRKEHFVYGCAITTYGGKGVLKGGPTGGCNASDHSVVYMSGSQPVQYAGEAEKGLSKDPIMIEPSDPSETMHPASRLRYGKMYAIEWNVKFRDIGMVAKHDRAKVLKYFKESQDSGFDPDTEDEADSYHHSVPHPGPAKYYTQPTSSSSHTRQTSQHSQSPPQYQYQQFQQQEPYGSSGTQYQYAQAPYAGHQTGYGQH
ncbi:hypothetical protein E8E11_010764 [Didymella keratinophila]|nr:hypothetical protein E8E11_010764 [Didymella keratinophila]